MSHEQMLAWLDQANAGTVQAAAARLTAAAKEIRKIAEELKVRPQYVEWKGEGADAFRTWTGDLANATLRLGDFGEDSATWLGHASDAIAQAQVSIPRDKAGAQANLDAATAAHNDPDAATVSHKSTTELAALDADKEKVRQEAAAQMTKLGQAYRLSATQLDGLERPRFPPPPKVIQPAGGTYGGEEVVSVGGSASGTSPGGGLAAISSFPGSHQAPVGAAKAGEPPRDDLAPRDLVKQSLPHPSDHVGMQVDGADVLPPSSPVPPERPVGPAGGGRVDAGGSLPVGASSPMTGGVSVPLANFPGRGPATGGGRPAVQPRRGTADLVSRGLPGVGGTAVPEGAASVARPVTGGRPAVPSGRGATSGMPGRVPGSNGIVGGRPASPAVGSPAGRPTSGVPRGTVVGGETSTPAGRGSPTQRTPARTTRAGIGQSRTPQDRRDMGPGAGAERGVVGGRPQPQRRSVAKPFTTGGSGLVRNQQSRDGTTPSNEAERTSVSSESSRPSCSRQNSNQDKETSDRRGRQETGQQGDRPTTWTPTTD
ncbi:translation initiation factor IF-2 [Streptomyces sp. NPDC051643]|uniref:translation initiation factor IF-2 n=1 Tax=Streptomyces sp. NPDC051643 TaxID=3365665 RepID=UPI0037A8202B